MEKVNTGLKLLLRFLLLLVAVSCLLGRIEIQEYRTLDMESDLAKKAIETPHLMEGIENVILDKTILQNNYRVVLKF